MPPCRAPACGSECLVEALALRSISYGLTNLCGGYERLQDVHRQWEHELDITSLRIPSNTCTVAFIPYRSVFPHAALVITHAGWQTINAALADGVPLLCILDGRDQPNNAARVLAAGAAVRADTPRPTSCGM